MSTDQRLYADPALTSTLSPGTWSLDGSLFYEQTLERGVGMLIVFVGASLTLVLGFGPSAPW